MRSFSVAAPLVATLAAAAPAGAELLARDLLAPGDALLTRDTATRLDWLDVTETLGLSVNEVAAGAGGFVGGGFRHATTAEMCALLEHAGLGIDPCPGVEGDPARVDEAFAFVALFGDTCCRPETADVTLVETIGFYDKGSPSYVGMTLVDVKALAPDEATIWVDHPIHTPDQTIPYVGHYLVRPYGDCDDALDNDGDGLVDLADPACFDRTARTESPQCDDDLDNDGDGRVDWDGGAQAALPDLQCAEPWTVREGSPRRCGLGFEVAAALGGLAARRSARWPLRRTHRMA